MTTKIYLDTFEKFPGLLCFIVLYKFLKKSHMAQRMHLNTLLDIMMMMLLDHYV